MSVYIHNCSTISVLDSFEQGILNALDSKSKKLIEPDYRQFIPPTLLRRMSKVIRLGVTPGLKMPESNHVKGIIVGTGVGCFDNSIQFSKKYIHGQEGLLSPTDFIQSTDNTIAGQLGLILKNNGYNITWTHKGIAFENALIDAMLLCNEETCTVLVGGVDEHISLFESEHSTHDKWAGEGSSFFILGTESTNARAKIEACETLAIDNNIENTVNLFLESNKLNKPEIILYGNSFLSAVEIPVSVMGINVFNYSAVCGLYLTNPAFAMHLAADIISNQQEAAEHNFTANSILVVNNFNDTDCGFIYLSKP